MMNWKDEVLDFLGIRRRSLIGRWAARLVEAVSLAAGSMEGATERAGEVAQEARRRTQTGLREAGERYRAGRDTLSKRLDALSERAAEIRERRRRRREMRSAARPRPRRRRRMTPMRVDAGRADRVMVSGHRPLDVRFSDGGTVRYRYYRRPSYLRRVLLYLRGRQVWPPR